METYRTVLRWTAVGIGSVGLLLGILGLVFPWSAGDFGFGEARLEWGAIGGEVQEEDEHEEWTWYDERIGGDDRPLRDHDGVMMLRVALPVYAVALFTVLLAVIFLAAGLGLTGGITGLFGASVGLVGAFLIISGIDDFENGLFSGFASQVMEVGAGQVLALIGMPLVLVAAILAIVSRLGVRQTPPAEAPDVPLSAPATAPAPQRSEDPSAFRIERRHRFR